MKKLLLGLLSLALLRTAAAQELNCTVNVLTPQIQASDKTIYETLKSSIRDFLNNRRWTGDKFQNLERIECSMVITISERSGAEDFKGNIQIQSRRPVYMTSYSSPMVNHQDNDFSFKYIQDQVLDFDESSNKYNLTSVLAYYAYIIIGMDYDSFSSEGGTPFYQKAQNIVNNAQSLPDRGWKSFENSRNRYWLVENLLNPSFKHMRQSVYAYHRLGLDRMSEKVDESRGAITQSLNDLRPVYQDKPNSFLMQFFFNAKSDEVVNIYSAAKPEEKAAIVPLLNLIDPGNISKYESILTGGSR
jgi:hypothetical protein